MGTWGRGPYNLGIGNHWVVDTGNVEAGQYRLVIAHGGVVGRALRCVGDILALVLWEATC